MYEEQEQTCCSMQRQSLFMPQLVLQLVRPRHLQRPVHKMQDEVLSVVEVGRVEVGRVWQEWNKERRARP